MPHGRAAAACCVQRCAVILQAGVPSSTSQVFLRYICIGTYAIARQHPPRQVGHLQTAVCSTTLQQPFPVRVPHHVAAALHCNATSTIVWCLTLSNPTDNWSAWWVCREEGDCSSRAALCARGRQNRLLRGGAALRNSMPYMPLQPRSCSVLILTAPATPRSKHPKSYGWSRGTCWGSRQQAPASTFREWSLHVSRPCADWCCGAMRGGEA